MHRRNVTFYGATLRALGAAVTFCGGGVTEGRFGLPSLVDLANDVVRFYGDIDQGIPGRRRGGPAAKRIDPRHQEPHHWRAQRPSVMSSTRGSEGEQNSVS